MATPQQVEEFKGILEKNRKQLEDERQALQRQRLEFADRNPEYEEEGLKETSLLRLEQEERRVREKLLEVDDALLRIGAGTYGRCQVCGKDIDPRRLRAMPWTPLCRDCAAPGQPTLEEEEAEETEDLANEPIPTSRLRNVADGELANVAMERLKNDGRVELEELRLVVQDGQAILDGVLPSDLQHAALLSVLKDDLDLPVARDDIRIDPRVFERLDRLPDPGQAGTSAGPEGPRSAEASQDTDSAHDDKRRGPSPGRTLPVKGS